jgi:predicted ATPase
MVLREIKYTRFKGRTSEWSVVGKQNVIGENNPAVSFGNINLIVGKNATGKSKTIVVLRQLADLLANKVDLSKLVFDTATYEVTFWDGVNEIHYFLDFKNGKVLREKLTVGDAIKIDRKENKGKIAFENVENKQVHVPFVTKPAVLAATRNDELQHPFLETLQQWGRQLFLYKFGTTTGKTTFVRDLNQIDEKDFDMQDSDDFVSMFKLASDKKGEKFTEALIADMKAIEYPLSKITFDKPKHFQIAGYALAVKEEDLNDNTDQIEMSQGMFRAFSLLIQMNYSLAFNKPSCILIDDIGEGLDYERVQLLINLIIDKAKNADIQVFMTSNDRFVMNKVPLEYWSAIQRDKKKSVFYNYRNSKETFDDFAFTGLNNFDFFATQFYLNGFQEYLKS